MASDSDKGGGKGGKTKRKSLPLEVSCAVKLSRVSSAMGMTWQRTFSALISLWWRSPVTPPAKYTDTQLAPKRCNTRATLTPPPPGCLRVGPQRILRVSLTVSMVVNTSKAGLRVMVRMSVMHLILLMALP